MSRRSLRGPVLEGESIPGEPLRDRHFGEDWEDYRDGLTEGQWIRLAVLCYRLGLADLRGFFNRYIQVAKDERPND